ncbi:hypothetical protein RRG08_036046 [Elysia crispata]|uniref:Uncharacterized protein n=1 Tax=Elysia crispata TaxID=231223 RepID=A0AAE1ALC2_9GAST|nr:hypothetical protein RRG08_036046 [Elysia crispata]
MRLRDNCRLSDRWAGGHMTSPTLTRTFQARPLPSDAYGASPSPLCAVSLKTLGSWQCHPWVSDASRAGLGLVTYLEGTTKFQT